jgi:hypothetical protein
MLVINNLTKKNIHFPINNQYKIINNKFVNNKKYNIQQMQNNKTIKHICRYI